MKSIKTTFTINGLHCPSCEKIVAKRIGKLPEILGVTVSLEKSRLSVMAPRLISELEIQQALSGTGYTVIK